MGDRPPATRIRDLIGAVAVCLIAMVQLQAGVAGAQSIPAAPDTLVGVYDGGQTEIAAGLELRADGRFLYALSYGALDEKAEGRWSREGDQVLLTSDPVVAPRLVLLGQHDAPPGRFIVLVDLPDGMSRQYFSVEAVFANGVKRRFQLGEELAPLDLAPDDRPTSITLALSVFDLRSDPVPLADGAGHDIHFRFDPNDLGKVAFARTALKLVGGDLVLLRHDRTLRFRREADSAPGG